MKLTKTLFPNLDLQQSNVDEDTFVGEHLEDIFGTLPQKNSWSKQLILKPFLAYEICMNIQLYKILGETGIFPQQQPVSCKLYTWIFLRVAVKITMGTQ